MLLGDPSVLEALAARYERDADCVRTAGHRLQVATGNANWACDAADRFRADTDHTYATASAVADEMCSMAQQLRVVAAEVREEIAQLMAIEARVRQLLAEMQQQAAIGMPVATAWHPGNLPPTCDPTWRTVGRSFGV
jgi:uncharacterized protein YukE